MVFLFLKPFLPFLLPLINLLPKNPSFNKISLFISHSIQGIKNWTISMLQTLKSSNPMPWEKNTTFDATTFHESAAAAAEMTFIDLPQLPLDCILEKLSPFELCNMAFVCKSLRGRCRSDEFWERHVREKWSKVIGEDARREWELQVEERRDFDSRGDGGRVKWKVWKCRLACLWEISWLKHKMECRRYCRPSWPIDHSLVSFYLALESGSFSFRAQVYNREVLMD